MRNVVVLALAVVAAAVGCGDGASATGPPEIEYGRDVCDECHMIVTEPRFAAAYRVGDHDAQIFDDPGDMLRHGVREDELTEAVAWVHDFETEAWLDAAGATYVHGGDVTSPMGYRIAAFADAASATAHAREHGGEVLEWGDLVRLARAGDLEPLEAAGEHEHEEDLADVVEPDQGSAT